MNLYNFIFRIALIFTFLQKSASDENIELLYPECGLITPSPLSIGLVLFIKINNTSDRNDYDIEVTPDECCLEDGDDIDCASLQIIGGCTDFIPKGETKTVKLIAPLLSQYERKGSCALYIDSKSYNGRNKRDTIKINFDTTYYKSFASLDNNYKSCKHIDEDPFNNCKVVNCDTHYNGNKQYFSRKVKRCVAVPSCVQDDDYDYPNIIYDPQTNQCLQESILKEDLEYIKSLRKDNGLRRKSKNVLIINKFNPNTTSLMSDNILIDDLERTTESKNKNTKSEKFDGLHLQMETINKPNCLRLFLKKYFIENKWTLLILVLVIIVQCILICTMIYCLSKTCSCCKEKKVIQKFFNYRQDVSVTTPLINTSNIDTETTDYQYATESSNNVDQKIKCYKACQKEKNTNNNVQKSMSDDILSKLLNRRDWKKKSQIYPEPEINNIDENVSEINQLNNPPRSKERSVSNETKVVFEDEKANNIIYKKQTRLVNVVNDPEISDNQTNDDQELEANISSEKEIKCHSYNHSDAGVAGYRANVAKNMDVFIDGKSKKTTTSNSIEKGAQAYFSNDSIDDFLSERGVIYLAGENMSKYTFSSGSNDMKPSLTSSTSSKTSKNFFKNVFSLLHKRSKQGPSSDPGKNKEIDLEIIHMSKASVYSSTNDSDCLKNMRRKDSRTSF